MFRHALASHLRRFWHVHLAALLIFAVVLAALLGAFAAPKVHELFKLNAKGAAILKTIDAKNVEQGQATAPDVTLSPAQVAHLKAVDARVAREQLLEPHPLATPQPARIVRYVVNQSSRNGAHPLLLVVHSTESPNALGLQDVYAIANYFNIPRVQASSNYTTDAEGNTIEMVPTSAKAWTQAYFNGVAISDELIGRAAQTSWPETQLRTVAEIFAHDAAQYGIPIREGAVSNCTVTRSGILEHLNLGACGGGHHDAGPAFPIARFVTLVKQYADAGKAPVVKSKPVRRPVTKPTVKCTVKQVQAALDRHGAHLSVDGVAGPKTKAALARVGFAHLDLRCSR